MTRKYLAEKQLVEGSTLKLKTWISDTVEPGKRMYQLELTRGNLTIQFPTRFEDYTEEQVREMYEKTKSKSDFDELRSI